MSTSESNGAYGDWFDIPVISAKDDVVLVAAQKRVAPMVKYQIFTKYGREEAASAAVIRPASEIPGDPLSFVLFQHPDPTPSHILYQKVGNALLTLLGLRVSIDGGDHLL
ncbi:hypothetical protein EVAR_55091_1 [Eumeta japonica]|uniref:Uncharacterized protein n=1 Tax=Eumeta variegata TaxID=151549 RepID=A0A4C1YEL8_EUMVA|nr:hypothetical protein EVAR_55091_1 [Eumeta japonica]